MQRYSSINVQISIPESVDTFLKLLPLSIRKKYIENITSAILKDNEAKIIENVQGIVQDVMNVVISNKDADIMQEELDRSLKDLGLNLSSDKTTIKPKKDKGKIKKDGIVGEEIEGTVLTTDIVTSVESIESKEAKDIKDLKAPNTNDLDIKNQTNTKTVDVKKLNLDEMFNR